MIKQSGVAVAAASAIALLGGGVAAAATHHTHLRRAASTGGSSETVLTGTALTQASDAAITAVPGGTVQRASTENPSDPPAPPTRST